MPGYRSLSVAVTGAAADSAREAESLRRDGDSQTAVQLLEEALEASLTGGPELPGWLCGRLAALYRTLGRYDDEVHLLERYRESQSSEEARSRYDARLSKARTIAERKRRSDSGALLSVRKVLGTPRRRSTPRGNPVIMAVPAPEELPLDDLLPLAAVLAEPTAEICERELDFVLADYCAAAREQNIAIERLVQRLRTASGMTAGAIADEERRGRFSSALVRLLAMYYEEREH